tara:strand:+ start:1716 stop:2006 length:291 start_codon:yes stop_codon:yes gene_type:complete
MVSILNTTKLTQGKLPKSLNFLAPVIAVLVAAVMGLLVGQGATALASRFAPAPIPNIVGGLSAFVAGGPVGAITYTATSTTLLGSVAGQSTTGTGF